VAVAFLAPELPLTSSAGEAIAGFLVAGRVLRRPGVGAVTLKVVQRPSLFQVSVDEPFT
jgi:hypothetical protein